MGAIVIGVLICLLVPLAPFLIVRCMPVTPDPLLAEGDLHTAPAENDGDAGAETESVPELSWEKKHPWLNRISLTVFFICWLVCGALWLLVFHYLFTWRAASLPPGVYRLEWGVFGPLWLVCEILGIYTAGLAFDPLAARLLLGARGYAVFTHLGLSRCSFTGEEGRRGLTRGFFLMTLFFGIGSAACVPLVMNAHTRFTEEAFIDRPLFGWSDRFYSYTSVSDLALASHVRLKDGKVEPRERLVVRCHDGRSLETNDWLLPPEGEERDRFLEFLSAKTGKPLRRVKFIEDVHCRE